MNLHRGSRNECPFCGFKSNGWAITGIDVPVLKERQVIGAGRRNAACYQCDSDDRERLVYLFLKDYLNLFDDTDLKRSILHIAPEPNLEKKISRLDHEYICGDLFEAGYEYPEYVLNMDVQKLPFEEGSFDLIICNHVLEHVENDHQAMSELYRVLRPSGKAILQVPISENIQLTLEDSSIQNPDERTKLFGQSDHVRLYGKDYVNRLEKNGFKVNQINISRNYPEYGLNPKEDIFLGEKL
ncbi:MAG: methyltransferase domain-containing protein [Cyclobacteriaceae bacterium]